VWQCGSAKVASKYLILHRTRGLTAAFNSTLLTAIREAACLPAMKEKPLLFQIRPRCCERWRAIPTDEM
jgi:hypothetical protein